MNEWGYYVDNLFSPEAELLIVCSISSSPAELFSANVAINFLSSSWNHKVTSIALFPKTASSRVKNNRNGNMDIISKSKLALDFSLPPVHNLYWYGVIRHTRFSICDLQSSQISASDKTEDDTPIEKCTLISCLYFTGSFLAHRNAPYSKMAANKLFFCLQVD